MKGGVGKTTLSTNVAHCLSNHEGKKVLLIDMDPQFNASQCFFSGEEYMDLLSKKTSTILDLFQGSITKVSTVNGTKEEKQKTYKDIKPTKINNNLYVLLGNLNLYQVEISPGSGKENRLKRYLKEIDNSYHFDYIIIDTPPTPSIWMTSALVASDYYIIPVKPDPLSYTGVDLLQKIVSQKKEDFDLNIKCIGIVLTMVEINTQVYKTCLKTIKKNPKLNKLLYNGYIPKRTDIPKQQLDKRFILDLDNADLNYKLTTIVQEMIKRIEKHEENK